MFWEILLLQLHSTEKFITSVISKKSWVFFEKHLFPQKTHFLKVRRNFTVSVACNSKLATFSNSTKIQNFFLRKVSSFLLKKPVIWTFSVFSPFESHSTENSLRLAFLKTFKICPRKPIELFEKKTFFERFEEFHYFSCIQQQLC